MVHFDFTARNTRAQCVSLAGNGSGTVLSGANGNFINTFPANCNAPAPLATTKTALQFAPAGKSFRVTRNVCTFLSTLLLFCIFFTVCNRFPMRAHCLCQHAIVYKQFQWCHVTRRRHFTLEFSRIVLLDSGGFYENSVGIVGLH